MLAPGSLKQNVLVFEVSRTEFEELVADALDEIPVELMRFLDNVVVLVSDDPPEPGLLGLYTGVPLTERGEHYSGMLPDQIEIYWREILAICETRDDVVEEVMVTVVHEIAHHFGIADERLHELGWA
ncbi:putative Zn-dependent protease with MMP-like domain [Allonocardiopsis opalescens]|uniref:Putative Zn-dependent protease with MMP-like domain n=1 Tax=Allonocardiopsis opalescens TaxID=1144618 RepID=A0A2T0QAY5_9ACTN|nr:putative Zn-dependent protease with MMP-like domain [Allonocardiopsis opalescens]